MRLRPGFGFELRWRGPTGTPGLVWFSRLRGILAVLLWLSPALVVFGADERSYISVRPFCAQANGQQTCVAVVKVFAANGALAVGRPVTLSSSRGAADAIGPANPQFTDAQGEVQFTIKSSVRGVATLTAACDGEVFNKGVIADGAAGLWSFEGDARDISRAGNHGTLQNGPGFVPGRRGQGIVLNGTNQFINVPHSASLNNRQAWSIESWIYLDELPSGRGVIAQKAGSSGGDLYLSISNRTARARCATRGGGDELNKYAVETSNNAFSAGSWTHIVAVWAGRLSDPVWDDGSLRIFVNGVQKKSWDIARYLCRNQSEPLSIGRDPAGRDYFRGKLDEVRLYNRPLYPPEIQRNREFATTVHFTLEPPTGVAVRNTQPECLIVNWSLSANTNVTSYRIYRSLTPGVLPQATNQIDEVPYSVNTVYDWDVEYGKAYFYAVTAVSLENESAGSIVVAGIPVKATADPRWYRGDTHIHSSNSWDVWYHPPQELAASAKAKGYDFLFITDHNSIVSRHELHTNSSPSFIGLAGEEVSLSTAGDNDHFNAFFIKKYVPGDGAEGDLHQQVHVQGGLVQPNHCGYYTESDAIDGLEVIHGASVKTDTVRAWDYYLQRGFRMMGRGSTDKHGDSGKVTTLLWLERLSYKELYRAFKEGRACAVTGPGIECMLKVNGAMIGDSISVPSGDLLRIEMNAASSTNVTKMELVKHGKTVWSAAPNAGSAVRVFQEVSGNTNTYYRLQVQDARGDWALGGAVYLRTARFYSLSASATPGGRVLPAGICRVIEGGSTNFTVQCDPDYRILDVKTNGASIGGSFNNLSTNTVFNWPKVLSDGTIYVEFAPRVTSGGIPFTWLARYGIAGRSDGVEMEDTDADGYVNLLEWIADTAPTNGLSLPPRLAINLKGSSALEISVPLTSTGRWYSVLLADDLPDATWSRLQTLAGNGSNMVFRPGSNQNGGYFRLGIGTNCP